MEATVKHQTITHWKFKALSKRLAKPLWQTVGLLESLWLFAIHNARDGNLSLCQPSDIASWIEYKGDATGLIEALVETRWLDRTPEGGLFIHDWTDHQPGWLKGVTSRQPTNDRLTTKSDKRLSDAGIGIGEGYTHQTTENGKSLKGTRFKKPTVAEVAAYCQERGNGIDAEEFIDSYERNGWVVGRNKSPMKDWRSAVRCWERHRDKTEPASRVATREDLEHFDLTNGQTR